MNQRVQPRSHSSLRSVMLSSWVKLAAAGHMPHRQGSKMIAEGNNEVTSSNDPTAHAEITAIRAARVALGKFRLDGCEICTGLRAVPDVLGGDLLGADRPHLAPLLHAPALTTNSCTRRSWNRRNAARFRWCAYSPLRRLGTESLETLCWRETDSNFQFRARTPACSAGHHHAGAAAGGFSVGGEFGSSQFPGRARRRATYRSRGAAQVSIGDAELNSAPG